MKIIIAEKPSVANEYAKVLGAKIKKNGYIEGNDWIVTWTVGHLVTLSMPEKYNPAYKKWQLETLPFLPGQFKYEVIEDVKKQFDIVKSLYNRSDIEAIYYAGDSGREGLYIQMLVRMIAGHNKNAVEKVVWIDSQTEDEIIRGISAAKPVDEYKNLADAGYVRAEEDYLVGINFSRVLSVLYAAMVNTGSGQKRQMPISVGRVMTCVLGMIVNREREIKNFKVTDFYRIKGDILISDSKIESEWRMCESSNYFNSPKLYSEFGFLKEADAKELIKILPNECTILKLNRVIEKKNAPLLFNLAELQGECTKYLHISPSETLKIAQSLYEKKLTTYPRTDARVLSSAVADEINKNLEGLKNSEFKECVEYILNSRFSIKGKYVNDEKITDHYAIIPTGKVDSSLSDMEKSVYKMIVKRFLAIFYPPAEYEKVSFKAKCNNELFVATGKYLAKPGFYNVLGIPDEDRITEEQIEKIKRLSQGSTYPISFDIKKGSTQPPKRYTSGSMVLAMENAGRLIENDELREQIIDNGIGTSATRADIIEKLIRLKYVNRDEKKQILTPSNLGEMIYEVVNYTVPDFLSPETTAMWEKKLSDIAAGAVLRQTFEDQMYNYVKDNIDRIKGLGENGIDEVKRRIRTFATSGIRTEIKEFENWNTKIKCPFCGDEVETTEWGFKCKSNISKTEGCSFVIGDLLGHRLLTKELSELLIKGKTGPFYDFISQKGKPFAAYINWNNDTKKITFDFTDMPWEKTELKCPQCGKKVLNQGNFYKCEDHIDFENGCTFWIGKIAGKSIGKKDIESLLSKGETELIKGFKSKDGNKFDAFLSWNTEKKKIAFRFPVNDELKTDLLCPICNGRILNKSIGFICENNRLDFSGENSGCKFFAGKIKGHQIKLNELKEIIQGIETDLIAFKTDDKKEYAARLYWNKEQQRISFKFDENSENSVDASCPMCGAKIIKDNYGYHCSNKDTESKCTFYVGPILGVLIDDNQIKKLIGSGKTDLITGFKPKEKGRKPFSAYLVWNESDNKVQFEFSSQEPVKEKSDLACPICFKKMYISNYGYYCDCGFKVNRTIAGKELTDEQIKKVLIRGESDLIYGFYSPKKRSLFNAKIKLNKDAKRLELLFDDKQQKESEEHINES